MNISPPARPPSSSTSSPNGNTNTTRASPKWPAPIVQTSPLLAVGRDASTPTCANLTPVRTANVSEELDINLTEKRNEGEDDDFVCTGMVRGSSSSSLSGNRSSHTTLGAGDWTARLLRGEYERRRLLASSAGMMTTPNPATDRRQNSSLSTVYASPTQPNPSNASSHPVVKGHTTPPTNSSPSPANRPRAIMTSTAPNFRPPGPSASANNNIVGTSSTTAAESMAIRVATAFHAVIGGNDHKRLSSASAVVNDFGSSSKPPVPLPPITSNVIATTSQSPRIADTGNLDRISATSVSSSPSTRPPFTSAPKEAIQSGRPIIPGANDSGVGTPWPSTSAWPTGRAAVAAVTAQRQQASHSNTNGGVNVSTRPQPRPIRPAPPAGGPPLSGTAKQSAVPGKSIASSSVTQTAGPSTTRLTQSTRPTTSPMTAAIHPSSSWRPGQRPVANTLSNRPPSAPAALSRFGPPRLSDAMLRPAPFPTLSSTTRPSEITKAIPTGPAQPSTSGQAAGSNAALTLTPQFPTAVRPLPISGPNESARQVNPPRPASGSPSASKPISDPISSTPAGPSAMTTPSSDPRPQGIPQPTTSVSKPILSTARPSLPLIPSTGIRPTAPPSGFSRSPTTGRFVKTPKSLMTKSLAMSTPEVPRAAASSTPVDPSDISESPTAAIRPFPENISTPADELPSAARPSAVRALPRPSLSPSLTTSGKACGGMARKQVSSGLHNPLPSTLASSSNAAGNSIANSSSSSSHPAANPMPPPAAPRSTSPKVLFAARKQCDSSRSRNTTPAATSRLQATAPRSDNNPINPSPLAIDTTGNVARPSEQKRKADTLASRDYKRRKGRNTSSTWNISPGEIIDLTLSDDEHTSPRKGKRKRDESVGPVAGSRTLLKFKDDMLQVVQTVPRTSTNLSTEAQMPPGPNAQNIDKYPSDSVSAPSHSTFPATISSTLDDTGPAPDSRCVWASVYDANISPKWFHIDDLALRTVGRRPCSDAYNLRHNLPPDEVNHTKSRPFLRRNVHAVIAGISAEKFPSLQESIKYRKTRGGQLRNDHQGSHWPSGQSSKRAGFEAVYERRLAEERNLNTARISRVLELPIIGLVPIDADSRAVHMSTKDMPRMSQLEMRVYMNPTDAPLRTYGFTNDGRDFVPGRIIRQHLDEMFSPRQWLNSTITFSLYLVGAHNKPYRGIEGRFETQHIRISGPQGEILDPQELEEPVFRHVDSSSRWKLFGSPRWATDYSEGLKPVNTTRLPTERTVVNLTYDMRDATSVETNMLFLGEWQCPSHCAKDSVCRNEQELAVHVAMYHRGECWVEPEIGPRNLVDGIERLTLVVHQGSKPQCASKQLTAVIAPDTGVSVEAKNQTAVPVPPLDGSKVDALHTPIDVQVEIASIPIPLQIRSETVRETGAILSETTALTPQSQSDDPLEKHESRTLTLALDKDQNGQVGITLRQSQDDVEVIIDKAASQTQQTKETKNGLAGPYMSDRQNQWTIWSTRVVPGTLADLMPELDKIYDGGKDRYNLRDLEELHIWQQHHLSDQNRFLACCWNRWRHQHVHMPQYNKLEYYEAWFDAYGSIMARAGLKDKVRAFVHTHYKHRYISFKESIDATRYYFRNFFPDPAKDEINTVSASESRV